MNTQQFKKYFNYIWSNKNYRLSLYLGTATLMWLASGLFGAEPKSKELAVQAEVSKTRVQAHYFDAEEYRPAIRVRARTQPNRQVSMRAEVSGKVVSLPVQEGQSVKTGDVICEIATEDRKLRLREAKSSVEQAQLEYDGSLRLKSGGYQSATAIAGAKARLDTAKAGLLRRQIDLANVKIVAPFDGVVDHHSVDIGDFMDRGDECGVVMDLSPLIVRGRVSETEVGRIDVGAAAAGALLTGQQVTGAVSLVGFAPDEVTRSFPVEVSVDNTDLTLRSGITTDLVIPTAAVQAHVISPSLLTLDDEGQLGVRTLTNDFVVKSVRITLIGDHDRGVWVSGLSNRALVVTQGQEYVSDGESVEAVIDNAVEQDNSPEIVTDTVIEATAEVVPDEAVVPTINVETADL